MDKNNNIINFNEFDEFDEADQNNQYEDFFIGHEEFYKFLIDNNILKEFIDNFNSTSNLWRSLNWDNYNLLDKYTLLDYLNNTISIRLINSVFKWSRTDQGFDFWYDINNKWGDKVTS